MYDYLTKMAHTFITLLFFTRSFLAITTLAQLDVNVVQMAHTMVIQATNWAQLSAHDESLILGHHHHDHRHHGGGKGGRGSPPRDDNLTEYESSLIFGHHGRHHGGGKGGRGRGTPPHDETFINGGGHDDNVTDESSLILGHHRHDRRHHGGGKGGRGGPPHDDTLVVGGGHDDNVTNESSLILGHHHHDRRHHGGGKGGRGGPPHDDILVVGSGHDDHHGGKSRGGGGGGHGSYATNVTYKGTNNEMNNNNYEMMALGDCAKLYEQAELLLARLLEKEGNYTQEDAVAWLSGALTSHRTCLGGLKERGLNETYHPLSQNLTLVLNDALDLHANKLKARGRAKGVHPKPIKGNPYQGLLALWDPATSKADIVVAKDGSGNYRTIKEAVDALGKITNRGGKRVVVHVRAGVYNENIEIGRHHRNVMFVGDGIDRTLVTGRRNYVDGHSTVTSSTFMVLGDGFWARDMTFENTAGPQKHQAVALMVASDLALFYRCSFKGYQDTLYVHSLRQFYRDCKIYGTIDFIFGNAAVVFQNCDILVRRPMQHQANMITAQGRGNPNENTGISIHGSRIRPTPEFAPVKGSIKTFLGRPWKKYSRTVVAKTDLDGLIHPKGWREWSGNFALSTLYYAEYMNTGDGASTDGRVNWAGYHVLRDPTEVGPFTVRNFLQGEYWIMSTGVPVWAEI